MPNYRYRAPDRTRRTPQGCQGTYPSPSSCTSGCRNTDTIPDCLQDLPLAMAYVPWQEWGNLYELDKAFMIGTIFEDLSKPFRGAGGCVNGR